MLAHTTLSCELGERTPFVSNPDFHWSGVKWTASTEGSNAPEACSARPAHAYSQSVVSQTSHLKLESPLYTRRARERALPALARGPGEGRGFLLPFTIVMVVDLWPMPGHKGEPLIQRKGCGDREEVSLQFFMKRNPLERNASQESQVWAAGVT